MILLPFLLAALGGDAARSQPPRVPRDSVDLVTCRVDDVPLPLRCGTYWVYEDRVRRAGRRIPLYIRIIPATRQLARDPLVFVSAGGPGGTNSDHVGSAYLRGWHNDREVVLVDLRGTSGPSRLDCRTPGSDEAPADYLKSAFDPSVVEQCRTELSRRADLRLYTTRNVVDDLHEVLVALKYQQVDPWGASGGTREVLEFVRRFPAMVRAAIVEGTVPVTFKNPLPHAAAAQEALDSLFAQCARDAGCGASFPNFHDEFDTLRARLRRHPVDAPVPPALGGRDSLVRITWPIFAELVREMSYAPENERTIPFVVHRAAIGDFGPLIVSGVNTNRRIRDGIRFGFLLSQTCSEDVPRITDADIARDTRGTYLGDLRVREQRAACARWPRAVVPASSFEPVRSDVPVFILSGTIDPVTRPSFGAEAARYLPNSIHVIAPGGHTPRGACVGSMERQFLARARPSDVDTRCVRMMTLPRFQTTEPGPPK